MSDSLIIKLVNCNSEIMSFLHDRTISKYCLSAKEKMFTLNCFKAKRINYIIKFITITTYWNIIFSKISNKNGNKTLFVYMKLIFSHNNLSTFQLFFFGGEGECKIISVHY